MKLSLKLQDDDHKQQVKLNPLVTAKIPVSIMNRPFLTSISSSSLTSDLSFSLSSNFASGPSLKLSYSPTTSAHSLSPPFSLSLKSGLGLLGSPKSSPLVFKAHFTFSSPNPTFSLHFKPQFGHFALTRTAFSNPRGGEASGSAPKPGNSTDSGHESGEMGSGSPVWQELRLEPCGGGFGENCGAALGPKRAEKEGVLSGVAVVARTVFPMGKWAAVNVRWGVNLAAESGARMPRLTMNKIAIERAEGKGERRKSGGIAGDLELLKGMCYWMTRDLEALERENQEMKRSLEEISKLGAAPKGKPSPPRQLNSGPRVAPPAEGSGEFERWKSRKNGKDENARHELKKPTSPVSDLESELQRAIAAAAGSSG